MSLQILLNIFPIDVLAFQRILLVYLCNECEESCMNMNMKETEHFGFILTTKY